MGEIAAAIESERSGVADAERHLRDLQTRLDTIGKVTTSCISHWLVMVKLCWMVCTPCLHKGLISGEGMPVQNSTRIQTLALFSTAFLY